MNEQFWHVLDDEYRIVVSNRSMTYAMNCAVNGLNNIESGSSLIVGYTNGYFKRNVPFFAHVKLTRLAEYVE